MLRHIILIVSALTLSACSSFGYYMDLMAGHSELLEQRKPIIEILAEKEASLTLRQLLKKSQEMRDFATNILYLPENDSYRQYADIKRQYAVWNVVAAKEFSIKPKKWCFLFAGCLSYRGYFSKEDATTYADDLKKEGYDVYVAGARAYSTLGWFDDPLLNTMMYKSEAHRAGIIFHELAHQVVYIDNDSAFNEAFATVVEEEGIRRWLMKNGKNKQYEEYLINKERDLQLNRLLKETREKLKILYKTNKTNSDKRKGKKDIFVRLQKKYQQLKMSWGEYSVYDKWMSQGLNNSHLVLIATYHDLAPTFKAMLDNADHDLKRFYRAVEELGRIDKVKRETQLRQIMRLANKEK